MNVKPTLNTKKIKMQRHQPFHWTSRPKGRSREQVSRETFGGDWTAHRTAPRTLDKAWTRARCDEYDSVVHSLLPIDERFNDAVLFDVPSRAVESLFCTRELDQDVQTVPAETSRAPTTATVAA